MTQLEFYNLLSEKLINLEYDVLQNSIHVENLDLDIYAKFLIKLNELKQLTNEQFRQDMKKLESFARTH